MAIYLRKTRGWGFFLVREGKSILLITVHTENPVTIVYRVCLLSIGKMLLDCSLDHRTRSHISVSLILAH